jgi:hypothetical protein
MLGGKDVFDFEDTNIFSEWYSNSRDHRVWINKQFYLDYF